MEVFCRSVISSDARVHQVSSSVLGHHVHTIPASYWIVHVSGIMSARVYYRSTQEVVPAGSMFIWVSQRWLEQFEDVKFQSLRGANARKVVLVVGIMAAHALGEGSGVGVSFCGQRGWSQVCSANSTHLPCVQRGLALA